VIGTDRLEQSGPLTDQCRLWHRSADRSQFRSFRQSHLSSLDAGVFF
jgi:hypothetical protein